MTGFAETLRRQARDRLVAGLLRLACRICGVQAGQRCDPASPDGEMLLLESDPAVIMIHAARAADAAAAGHVSLRTLLAQFRPGEAPASLTGK